MNVPTATVVVCVRNRPQQLIVCLQSLVCQDYPDYEVVVVDDASNDETPIRLQEFCQSHSQFPIRTVRNQTNLGTSGARNVGITAARGEYIAFTDSDCVVPTNWLRELVAPLVEAEVAAAAGAVLDESPRNMAELAYRGTCQIGQTSRQGRALVGNNMVIRRNVLHQFPFDEALNYYCDEDDLATRLCRAGHRIAFTSRAVATHNHRLDLREFLRLTVRQGVGSARYWYKHNLWIGRDLIPLTAALVTVPLVVVDARFWCLPAAFLALQVAALIYNEIAFKGKALLETAKVLPLCLLGSLVRAQSVYRTLIKIAIGGEPAIRISKRRLLGRA